MVRTVHTWWHHVFMTDRACWYWVTSTGCGRLWTHTLPKYIHTHTVFYSFCTSINVWIGIESIEPLVRGWSVESATQHQVDWRGEGRETSSVRVSGLPDSAGEHKTGSDGWQIQRCSTFTLSQWAETRADQCMMITISDHQGFVSAFNYL